MSIAGPDQKIDLSVYAKMSTEAVWEKLYKASKIIKAQEGGKAPDCLWLLRESNINGCLTLSYIKANEKGHYDCYHTRYILFFEENKLGWECVSSLSEDEIKRRFVETNKMVFMNMSNVYEEKYQDINKQLLERLKTKGFKLTDYLPPSECEESRNSHYKIISSSNYLRSKLTDPDSVNKQLLESATTVLSQLEEQIQTVCPITRECIGDQPAAMLTTPHLYNSVAINQWLNHCPSDPLTRKEIRPGDILFTNVVKHAGEELQLLKDAIEKTKKQEIERSDLNENSNKKPRK